MQAPQFKQMRAGYGFDEVAIVPGDVTVNPEQVNIEFTVGPLTLALPILASAMDAVVDPQFAAKLSKFGGLAVLNLEGVQTRYDNPDEVLAEIASTPQDQVTTFMQKVYSQPIKENLIGDRIRQINREVSAGHSRMGAKRFIDSLLAILLSRRECDVQLWI